MKILESCKNTWFVNNVGMERLQTLIHTGDCQIRQYAKGQVVHTAMSPCTTLDLILSGALSVNRLDADGNIVHIAGLKACDTLGGILLYASHNRYPFDVSALEETSLLQIEKGTLLTLLYEIPNLLPHFLKDLSDKSTLLTRSIHTLSEKSLRHRIMQFLNQEAALQGSNTIVLGQTKKLIAESFGVARTSLSRELKHMQEEGILHIKGNTIRILKQMP